MNNSHKRVARIVRLFASCLMPAFVASLGLCGLGASVLAQSATPTLLHNAHEQLLKQQHDLDRLKQELAIKERRYRDKYRDFEKSFAQMDKDSALLRDATRQLHRAEKEEQDRRDEAQLNARELSALKLKIGAPPAYSACPNGHPYHACSHAELKAAYDALVRRHIADREDANRRLERHNRALRQAKTPITTLPAIEHLSQKRQQLEARVKANSDKFTKPRKELDSELIEVNKLRQLVADAEQKYLSDQRATVASSRRQLKIKRATTTRQKNTLRIDSEPLTVLPTYT